MKMLIAVLAICSVAGIANADLKFRMQEIDTTLKIGYGVIIADVNDDKRPDIVVCDARRVVWYENPTWKRRIIIEDQTPPDNVCIAPCDIDRDGKIDFFLGADWGRMDTTKGGTIHWMRRGKSLDDKWEVFKIGEEPTVHRMRVYDRGLIVAPLVGRDSTKEKNWMNGRPVRILVFHCPKNLTDGEWSKSVINENLHVVHNFWVASYEGMTTQMLFASYEGITSTLQSHCGEDEPYSTSKLLDGNQQTPNANRGCSEIRVGRLKNNIRLIATVEPWHGSELVSYSTKFEDFEIFVGAKKGRWKRVLLDDKLRCGHGLQCADLDGDGNDEVIAGIRDDLSKNPGERRGIRVYKCTDGKGEKWDRQIVDDGGIACEDLVVHDLNGDGRPDIIATGRQTGNVRIYWNQK